MLKVRSASIIAVILTLGLGLLPPSVVLAASACSTTITPTSIPPGTQSVLQYEIHNTGSDPIAWIQVQRPSVSYLVNGVTQSGWTDTTTDDGTTLDAGSLAAGATFTFELAVFTAPQEEGAGDWDIQVSPNSDGSSRVSCSGAHATSIITPPTPPTPNGESGIGLTAISPTSVTISWNSDVPSTSYVYYGLDSAYGDLATSPGSTISHSVVLTGLTPNTIYHYMVAGSDSSSNLLFSGDNTFITPVAPPAPLAPVIVVNNVTTGGSVTTPIVIPRVPGDTTAPVVALDTVLGKAYATAPLLRGHATDNGALAQINYSVDGGRNWLPVANVVGLAGKTATFSFTPAAQDDGNYELLVAAVDSNGNETKTTSVTLVIDRLPPQIGPFAVSYGPEVLTPSPQGAMELLAGSNYHFSASSVGGATMVSVEAQPQETLTSSPTTFTLTQSPDSGLWNGLISFRSGGIYQLVAKSRDGAGNVTSRNLLTIAATPTGRVLEDGTNHPQAGARLTVYYLESSTRSWQVWNGAPYDQTNPQVARADGGYSFVLPEGTYYLKVTATGHHDFISDRFTVTQPMNVASTFHLGRTPQLNLGSIKLAWPGFTWQSRPLPAPEDRPIASSPSLVGKALPDFSLPTLTGARRTAISLQGRPTVLSLLTTWSPGSQDQIGALAAAQGNKDVNVVPVFSQERIQFVATYLATAHSSLTGLVDADGVLVPHLTVGAVPAHIFVDRNGRIKKVMLGVLSKDELLNQLGGL